LTINRLKERPISMRKGRIKKGGRRRSSGTTNETAKRPELLAVGLIKEARTYLESARQLGKLIGSPTRFYPSIYFLLCQAMELAMKAHLAASGVPNRMLRICIAHDIKLAFRYGRRYFEFLPADDRFPELVRWLAPFHLDHSFRYRKAAGLLQLPSASEAVEIIDNTIGAIEPYVRDQFVRMRSRAAHPTPAEAGSPGK
jgi:hypothetical protein